MTTTDRSPYTGHTGACAAHVTLDAGDCDCVDEETDPGRRLFILDHVTHDVRTMHRTDHRGPAKTYLYCRTCNRTHDTAGA